MALKISQDMIVANGRTLMKPAWKGGQEGWQNLAFPDIRDIDAIQKYPVGTKLIDGERVFYYAKASSVGITNVDHGAKNGYAQHVRYGAVTAVAVTGAKEITITVNGSDGIAGDGDIAVNELAGGFVVVFNHDDDAFVCRILENTATDGGGDIVLQLQDEIPVDLAVGAVDHAECMAHWALGCETNDDGEEPVVGVSQAKVTGGYWFWLQTWGPLWLSLQGTLGANANDMQAVFRHNGSLDEHDPADDSNPSNNDNVSKQQHAGFTLCHAIGGGQGAAFIMLQICP